MTACVSGHLGSHLSIRFPFDTTRGELSYVIRALKPTQLPVAVRAIHDKDEAEGRGTVPVPDALDRKYPTRAAEWSWQWVFPQNRRWINRETGLQGRHHIDESLLQKAVLCLSYTESTHKDQTEMDIKIVENAHENRGGSLSMKTL